jgi:hypothetical protein
LYYRQLIRLSKNGCERNWISARRIPISCRKILEEHMSLTRRHFIESASLSLLATSVLRTGLAQSISGSQDATFNADNLSLLQDVTEETFKPYVGESFAVSQGNRRVGSLNLHSVTPAPAQPPASKLPMVGKMPPSSEQAINSFSLHFRGSGTPLPQGTYTFKNGSLGSVSLFIVPGDETTKPYTYTASFCLLIPG